MENHPFILGLPAVRINGVPFSLVLFGKRVTNHVLVFSIRAFSKLRGVFLCEAFFSHFTPQRRFNVAFLYFIYLCTVCRTNLLFWVCNKSAMCRKWCGFVLGTLYNCTECDVTQAGPAWKISQIKKVIDRPTQTPLCGFTFATQKPLIKASLWRVCLWAIYLFCMI